MTNRFLGRRAQMALVGVGLWVLLALWSLSAFWAHIDSLGESYRLAAKCGAMAGEFALLALVLWHCFDPHINVRRWSLILGFALTGVILVHAGALRGMGEARTAQTAQVNDLSAKLTQMSAEQGRAATDSAASNAGTLKAQGISQRERLAISKGAQTQAADTARAAQDQLAKQVMSVDERVKAASILPEWYLNGWCYAVIFIISSAFVGSVFLMMMSGEVDANYNGVPDRLERAMGRNVEPVDELDRERIADIRRERAQWEFDQQRREAMAAKASPSPAPAEKPRAVWRGGRRIDPGAPVVEPKRESSH